MLKRMFREKRARLGREWGGGGDRRARLRLEKEWGERRAR